MARIAVFGATGFVGASVVERLLESGEHEVLPLIHRTGKAWRLARRGLSLQSVDVRDAAAVQECVRDVSHVVNCTLGPREVMLDGLDNLLEAARGAKIERFVHLSSVSVWGDRETGSVLAETDAPSAQLTPYGELKALQDAKIAKACGQGLSIVSLAPPMIGGPHSPFLLRVTNALRNDTLALIDGGALPCSLCDVDNVAHAVERALFCEQGTGTPYLVTDESSSFTWADMVRALLPLAEREDMPPALTLEDAHRFAPLQAGERLSPRATLRAFGRALASPGAREALLADPLLTASYGFATQRAPRPVARWVRDRFGSGRKSGQTESAASPYDTHLLEVQIRAVRHQTAGIREVVGFEPTIDSTANLERFVGWQNQMLGRDSADWPLLRELWQPARTGSPA